MNENLPATAASAYAPPPGPDESSLDLGEIVRVLLENRWLILTITALCLLAGLFYAATVTPIYRADALLQIEEKQSGIGALDINQLFESETPVTAEIEILRSRSVLGAVVDNLALDIVAEPDGRPVLEALAAVFGRGDSEAEIRVSSLELPASLVGQPLVLVKTGDEGYRVETPEGDLLMEGTVGTISQVELDDGATASIFVSKLDGGEGQEYSVTRSGRLGAIQSLKGNLAVAEQGSWSGILEVTLTGTNPAIVSKTIDEIVNTYVRQNVERKSAEAQQTLQFLDEQLPDVRGQMEAAEVALNSYRLEKGSIDLPLETRTILETIVATEGEINNLHQQRDKALEAFTEAHPTIIVLDRQIARLRDELEELNRQVRELPNTQQELLSLVRDAEVTTALYTSLLNTAQELRVVRAGTVGNARVIDHAVQPQWPISPNKSRIALFSLMLGGIVGVGAAFLRNILRAGVHDPDLIEKHTKIPVYATIPHSKNQDRLYARLKSKDRSKAILATEYADDPAVESLRNFRTALHFGMMDAKNNCIMIAGPSPTVGKSFISVNLAAVLASNAQNVLLIDGDLRRGHLHEYLGLTRDKGLSDYISGTTPIDACVQATSVPELMFMPTGKIPPNPAELLLHERFLDMVNTLGPQYNHIIIDSPPVLAVTDATIIGQVAGATILVLRDGDHTVREIEQSVKRLKQSGVNLRGILLNDVKQMGRRYGGYGYAYQYSYAKPK